jgi:hypothetical protein
MLELDSSNLQAANLHHTRPYDNSSTFSQPVEAPATATSPAIFEAGSSDYSQTQANELHNEHIREEHYTHSTSGDIPGPYHLGDQTIYNTTEPKATGAVTGAGNSTEVNDEISYLKTQQEKLRIKRERLKQLEEIDEEESRIQERLAHLMSD